MKINTRGTSRRFRVTVILFLTFLLFGVGLFYALPTRAVPGDFAIYRESGGNETITTTPTALPFDVAVSEGTGFSIDGTDTYISLAEQGHYLVMYNLSFENISGAGRSEVQGALTLESWDMPYGRSTCHILRNTGLYECWSAGAAVIESTSTDASLSVKSYKTDTSSAGVRRRSNESGLMAVRLDDDWTYARFREEGGGQTFNTTSWTTVDFDTQDELDTAITHTSGAFTLAESGHYLITSTVMFRESITALRGAATRLTLNGYELPGTRVTAYMVGTNSVQDHVAGFVGIIEATTTNQILRLQGVCDGEQCGNVSNVGGQTGITITKLPDTAEYVRLTEATDGQLVDATSDPITWDTALEVNTKSFSHSIGATSSQVRIEKDGDFLFFASFYANRTSTTNTNNQMPHWSWRKNGTTLSQYGSFAKFNQGDYSSSGIFSSGNSGGVLFSGLTKNQYIEILNTEEGSVDDPLSAFQPYRIGLQGVRLASLIPPDVSVSTRDIQTSTSTIPNTNFEIGAMFVLRSNKINKTVEDITITENGTVDASLGLENVRLYYDQDTTSPHICDNESFDGTESQFGVTSSFSSADGSITFSDSVVVGTSSTMCLYVVMDVVQAATNAETIEFQITDPSEDVVLNDGVVGPENEVVSLSGTTYLMDDELTQTHFHWRLDNGTESNADSATLGVEDTTLIPLTVGQNRRLRLSVSNEGGTTSPAVDYRLEFGEEISTCDAIASWTDVNALNDEWDMFDSLNLTEGDNTTNIAENIGGVTDENAIFLTPNGGVRDTSSQTGGIVLETDEFVEIEYSVIPTVNVNDGATYCFRVTDAGVPIARYDAYARITIAADVFVSATSVQQVSVDTGVHDIYIGGVFAITEQSSSRDVESVTITENGTVDALNSLSNIRLFYEMDTSTPYDCASESYDGTENQYGATAGSFNTDNGTATFTQTIGIATTSALCLYPVLDVLADAQNGETIELEIQSPTTDVVLSSGSINPNESVSIEGTTTVRKAELTQVHYHFRNDDGTEAGASSATGGLEDTPVTQVAHGDIQRIRIGVSNEGATTSTSTVYSLEYGKKIDTCDAVTWKSIGLSGGELALSDTLNLTDGSHTTNILVSNGGITDENTTFIANNNGVLDESANSSALALSETEFIELEYSLEATSFADFGDTYCLRVTGNNEPLFRYDAYPQLTLRQNQDFYIQRGEFLLDGTTKTLTAGVDYIRPSASTSAFIRITNTQLTGAGRSSLGATQQPHMVTTFIQNPSNLLDSVTFERGIDTSNTYVAWEIIEYTGPIGGDNEIVVHSADNTTMVSGDLTSNVEVLGVEDDDQVVVFITAQGNSDTSETNYNLGLATAEWNGSGNEVILEREESGTAVNFSFAVVEFTGANWRIQRVEHSYTVSGSWENETISTVNDIGRTFLHVQKRTNQNGLDEYGHEVYLHDASTVRFQLEGGASASTQVSVAWIIENTQTNGFPVVVHRSSGTQTGGSEAAIVEVSIGTSTRDITTSSIFTNNRVSGSGTTFPQAMMGVYLSSTSTYELFISDTAGLRTYRTEVVEWPTAVLSIEQNYYRFYVDNDALLPLDPWPAGVIDVGENTTITGYDEPPKDGDQIRLRMSLNITGASISKDNKDFKLQFGVRDTSCSSVTSWTDIGDAGSTTAVWRGYNATPLDGSVLSTNPPTGGDLLLSVSDRSGTYEENSTTGLNPYKINIGEDVEYDWALQANNTIDQTIYCFRMVESDGDYLDEYVYYPTLTVAGFQVEQQDWQWYEDENSITPSVPFAGLNVAPSNISNGEALKLRVVLEETAGRDGMNTKYKLQWSEVSDFSTAYDVVNFDACTFGSTWCYFDGAGTEGARITTNVLASADSCIAGVGDGCGTHNESSYTPDIVGEVGTTTTDSAGTTVVLQHTYDDPVFILESITGDSEGGTTNDPAVAIITATTTSSFTVRIQEPDNEADDHGVETVAYIVMERGSYQLPDGRKVDVGTIDTNNYYGDSVSGYSDDVCIFSQTFSNTPVVLASLQSDNNTGVPDFLTASVSLITPDDFACSMEVPDGETNEPSAYETIGWMAIEGGTFTNNTIAIEATSTSESITGWTDTPWYEQIFSQLYTKAPGIVATKQTRNGAEGGWVRYGNVDFNSTQFAIDERDDGERAHTAEKVGYISFSENGVLYRSGDSDFVFPSTGKTEFEYTITHFDARPNVTYFFRLYDISRNEPVGTSTTSTHPSLSTEGSTLSFSVGGIASGVISEGFTTDITTTATSVPFGSLNLGVPKTGAQRITVTTNATEGYQVFAYEQQELMTSGAIIEDVEGTNQFPTTWTLGCLVSAKSCYGYHAGDDTLQGGSNRFLLNDTFAALTGDLEEVAYSSGPVQAESTDIVYRVEVKSSQPAGQYESKIVYIVVPVF